MTVYPGKDDVYVPALNRIDPPEVTIEDVKTKGVLLLMTEDKKEAIYQVTQGLVVSFVGVFLDENMVPTEFTRKRLNKYVTMRPVSGGEQK